MRLYLTGADGMLGTALRAELAGRATSDWSVLGVSVADFDIGDGSDVRKSIDAFAPDVVVHTAAHAIVDDCEANPELALRVNVAGTRNVADACRRAGCRMVYISSDYVFDGSETPDAGYRETDTPGPVSVYGLTKLAGERITGTVADHLIVRTSWLFGGADERTDQVLAMVRQAGRGERPKLISDQFSRPTYTRDLARALVFLLTNRITGTVHVANAGRASWYDVGRVALAGDGHAAQPVSVDEQGFIGRRPRDSSLNIDRLGDLGHRMPSWDDAIARFLRELDGKGPS